MTDNTRTDAALAEVERRIVNLGDTGSRGVFDRTTLNACADIVARMRRDCAPQSPRAEVEMGRSESDAEFYRLRAQHRAGDHSECPPIYCLTERLKSPVK